MKTKLILIMSIMIIMIINITTTYAVSTYGVYLTINPKTIKVGETFTVTLSAKCEDGINGIDTTYEYDKNMLELVSANVVDAKKWASLGIDNQITVICNSIEKIKEADIYQLTFKVKETVKPGTTIKIKTTDILLDSDAVTNSEHTITAKELIISVAEISNPENTGDKPEEKPDTDPNPEDKPDQKPDTDPSENPDNKPAGKPDTNSNNNGDDITITVNGNNKDNTLSVEKLPMTGNEIIIPVAILGLIILSYILHKLYIKYKKI